MVKGLSNSIESNWIGNIQVCFVFVMKKKSGEMVIYLIGIDVMLFLYWAFFQNCHLIRVSFLVDSLALFLSIFIYEKLLWFNNSSKNINNGHVWTLYSTSSFVFVNSFYFSFFFLMSFGEGVKIFYSIAYLHFNIE